MINEKAKNIRIMIIRRFLKGYPVDKILKEIQIPGAFCGLVGENITLK